MADSGKQVINENGTFEPPKGTAVKEDNDVRTEVIKPPQASTFTVKQNGKATVYARKFTPGSSSKTLPPVPKYNNDLFSRIRIEENIHLDDGPDNITIDVQPDYRNIFLSLNYHVSKIYQDLNIKDNPLLTPPSLMAYLLSQIYAHALIGETSNVRHSRSDFANDFTADDQRRDLLTLLENSPVPDFLTEILNSLSPTCDPRRPGIQFVHSLACYSFVHDFGRAYPITAFLRAHNLIASRQANTPVEETMDVWYDTTLIEYLLNDNPTSYLKIRNIFGAQTKDGTYPSHIINAVETLFNPVTQRTNTHRPTFSRIQTFPMMQDMTYHINPYLYLLGSDYDNILNVTTFIASLSPVIGKELNCTRVLGATFNVQAGINLQIHYYSPMSFPTWYKPQLEKKNDIIAAQKYASTVGFMTKRSEEDRYKLRYPTNDCAKEIHKQIYLVNPQEGDYNPKEDPDKVEVFNKSENITPDVQHFDPWNYIPSSYAFTIVNGIHIETSHICGFSIPQPNIKLGLVTENAQFLQSAIPIRYIYPAFMQTAESSFICIKTAKFNEINQPISMMLGALHLNRLPVYDRTIAEPENVQVFPRGFIPQQHIGKFERSSNRFAMQYGSLDQPETATNWSEKSFHAWSSYRYFNGNLKKSTDLQQKISFILNFRTIYGTNVTMARSKHPFLMIPTA